MYVGVRDLDLGDMITFSTRVNKTYKTHCGNKLHKFGGFKFYSLDMALVGI